MESTREHNCEQIETNRIDSAKYVQLNFIFRLFVEINGQKRCMNIPALSLRCLINAIKYFEYVHKFAIIDKIQIHDVIKTFDFIIC